MVAERKGDWRQFTNHLFQDLIMTPPFKLWTNHGHEMVETVQSKTNPVHELNQFETLDIKLNQSSSWNGGTKKSMNQGTMEPKPMIRGEWEIQAKSICWCPIRKNWNTQNSTSSSGRFQLKSIDLSPEGPIHQELALRQSVFSPSMQFRRQTYIFRAKNKTTTSKNTLAAFGSFNTNGRVAGAVPEARL